MTCQRFKGLANAARGEAVRLQLADIAICFVRCQDGRFFAVSDACTHEEDASLSEGWVDGAHIECARHNSIFDLETGQPLSIPAIEPLKTFKTTIDGDDILIEVL